MSEQVLTASERGLLVLLVSREWVRIDDPALVHAKEEMESLLRKLGNNTTQVVTRHGVVEPEE